MADNIPVSTLSASLTLDVAGFAAGVRQAEVLSRRLAKAQAEALGGPALRRAGGDGVAQQVIRAQELRVRALANPDMQGPVGLRQGNIDAEITAEMAKRVQAAQRRVEIEQQSQQSVDALRSSAASDDAQVLDLMVVGREQAVRRQVQLEEIRREAFAETARQAAANEELMDAAVQAGEDRRVEMVERSSLEQRRLNRALGIDFVNEGRINTRDAEASSAFNDLPASFSSLAPKAAAAQYAIHSIGNTSADSQKKMRDFNLRILQGGYQLQDFVVQVGSGTNALVALAQQGSQMAGFFGAAGAWVGVGLAVASLATNMLLMSQNSKEASKEVKSLTEETDGLLRARRGLIEAERSATRSTFSGESEMMASQARRTFSESDFREADGKVKQLQAKLDELKAAQARRENAVKDYIPTGPEDMISVSRIAGETGVSEKDLAAITQAETDLVEARKKRTEMTKQATDAEETAVRGLNQSRKAIMEVLFPDRKPLVDEETVSALIKVGALTEQQVQSYRTLLQIQKLRTDSDILSGKTNAEQVEILRRQSAEIRRRGLEESEAGKEVSKQLRDSERAAKLEARGYLDQLHPLRAKRRELEEINRLQQLGLLPAGTSDKFKMRFIDEARRSLKIPDQLSISGAMSSGGFAGNAAATTLLEANRKMLTALEKIVSNTALMAGNN